MQSPANSIPNRFFSIDGLRGVAALAVLIYHARAEWWVGTKATFDTYGLSWNINAWAGYLTLPFSFGSLGVTLFFVLSGYCIHRRGARNLASDPLSSLNYRDFFTRRFWRIYPTYFAALLVTLAVDKWIAHTTGIVPVGEDSSFYAFIVSLLTLQGYFAPHFGSNGVFWTLAMEVHLYIAYPILYVISKKFGPSRALQLTFLSSVCYFFADSVFHISNFFPYRRIEGPVFIPYWFTWASGFYLAEIEAKRAKDFTDCLWWLVIVAGFAFGLLLHKYGQPAFSNIPWALFFVGILRLSLKPSGERIWSSTFGRTFATLGVFSYSLYAIHAPILNAFSVLVGRDKNTKFDTIWPALSVAFLTIPIAWIFFRFVENWSININSPRKG